MTLDQLAEKAGVSVATIIGIEKGRNRTPSGLTLYRLAKALGLESADLEVERASA